jgi:serpin B
LDPPHPDVLSAAATACNQFAFDLQRQIGTAGGNYAFSPASLATALGMTSAGAVGETRREMLQVLHASEDPSAWLAGLGGLTRTFRAESERGALQVANRLWGQDGFQFRPDFLELLEREFAAPIGRLDFAADPEASRAAINDWASRQTQQRIENLLPPGCVTGLTRLVLTNAIYFKADWIETFDVRRTQKLPFHLAGGEPVEATFMRQEGSFAYAEDERVQLLEMLYAAEGLSMVVILPTPGHDLAEVEQSLNDSQLRDWCSQLHGERVQIALPKFKLETALQLKPTLRELGMPRAFGPEAEFGGMSHEDELEISDVVHKAMVQVDEQGTEAAAATGVIVGIRSAAPSQVKVFQADRPFLFLIRHQASGALLFLGRVANPAAA